MDRRWYGSNPFALTKKEVQEVERTLEDIARMRGWCKQDIKVVELFGGSGRLSRYLAGRGWKEIVYCDVRKFVDGINGVRVWHEDFEEVARTEDGRKVVFVADPPFYGVPCWCKWGREEHRRLFKILEDIQGGVVMLNRADLQREGWERTSVLRERMDQQLEQVGGIGIFVRTDRDD